MSSARRFLAILKKEGLEEKFLAEASQSLTVVDPEVGSGFPGRGGFLSSDGLEPKALAEAINGNKAADGRLSEDSLQASFLVEANLMEFSRRFALENNLTENAIVGSLEARRCGNGIECPPGQ